MQQKEVTDTGAIDQTLEGNVGSKPGSQRDSKVPIEKIIKPSQAQVNVLDIGDSELSPDIHDHDMDDDGLETKNISIQNTTRQNPEFNDTSLENNVKTLHQMGNKDLEPAEQAMLAEAGDVHLPEINRTDNRLKTHSKYEPKFPTSVSPQPGQQFQEGNATQRASRQGVKRPSQQSVLYDSMGAAIQERGNPMNINSLTINPDNLVLDEKGDPLDYFNIYKRKMQQLARERFDKNKDDDKMFFNYLDRLVNAEDYKQRERSNGMGILKEFVTDHDSLSYVKKRNDIDRRWEYYRNERIQQGLPADPVETDPAYIQKMMERLRRQMTKKAVPQKSFHPDLEEDKRGVAKNFIMAQKFGQNRDYRPPWKDPNPIKYGGKYGMQNMKEMIDTGYQRGKQEHVRRIEFERKANFTDEQLAEQEMIRQEMAAWAEANKVRLTDLNDEKKYDPEDTTQIGPRSFLIQPEKKSLKSRLPSIFSGNSPTNEMMQNFPGELMTSDRSGKFKNMKSTIGHSGSRILNNQTTHKYLEKVDTIGTIDGSSAQEATKATKIGQMGASNSNASFNLRQSRQRAFGKRSQSMAQPGMQILKGKGPYDSYYMLDDSSREMLDQYKSMLMRQGSSKVLLDKIQSDYSNMQTVNQQNDDKTNQNLEQLKGQIMEPNTQIMNPPIEEQYDHKTFNTESKVEQTVILSFALEEMRNNPNFLQGLQRRGSRCVYKMRHGAISPQVHANDKVKIFDTLTQELRIAQTQRKMESKVRLPYPSQTIEEEPKSRNISELRLQQDSLLSSQRSLKSTNDDNSLGGVFNRPFYVIFIKDGASLSNKKTLNIKCNISKFIKKYMIEPPKYIARLPDSYIKSQVTFFERAYLEILEHCNENLNPPRKDDDIGEPDEFKTMFSADGKHLKTIADIQEFLLSRADQATKSGTSKLSQYNSIQQQSKVSLPAIGIQGGNYGSVQQLNSPVEIKDYAELDGGSRVVNKVKKAQFISYQASVDHFEMAPQLASQSQLSSGGKEVKDPPPIILVSTSEKAEAFKGIGLAKAGLTNKELRVDNCSEMKNMYQKQQGLWGSKRFLDWIESNLESGHSETQNMEFLIKKDTQLRYSNTNDDYRHQIVEKLRKDTNSTNMTKTKLFRPVYLGGGLNPKSKFLKPIADDGIVSHLRGKYRESLDHQVAPPPYTGLQLDFSSKFLPHPNINYESQETLQQQSYLSPSKMSLLHDQERWNKDFVDKVDHLKKQYLEKEKIARTDRNHRISPDKRNFEALSYQQSQENIGTSKERLNYIQQVPILNREQKMAASMKKISVNLNLHMNEEMEARLAKSLTKKPSRADRPKKEHVSKNIPHLNIDKKQNQPKINHKEVNSMSEEFNLPVTQIYSLQTEYQSLVDLKNEKQNVDLQILGGQSKEVAKQLEKEREEATEEDSKEQALEGIPVEQFIDSFQPLKEKHRSVVDRIFVALGVTKGVVNLRQYMQFNSLLKFYSPASEVFLDFWIKFLNPLNQPQLLKDDFVNSLELLARGRMTSSSTLISESYAQGFFDMLKQKKCVVKSGGTLFVDMIKFKKKIQTDEIDIKYLNQCLKVDSDFSTEGMGLVAEPDGSKSIQDPSSHVNTMNTLGNYESQKSEPQVSVQ